MYNENWLIFKYRIIHKLNKIKNKPITILKVKWFLLCLKIRCIRKKYNKQKRIVLLERYLRIYNLKRQIRKKYLNKFMNENIQHICDNTDIQQYELRDMIEKIFK